MYIIDYLYDDILLYLVRYCSFILHVHNIIIDSTSHTLFIHTVNIVHIYRQYFRCCIFFTIN